MQGSDTQPVIDVVKALHKAEVVHSVDGKPLIISKPHGMELVSAKDLLDKFLKLPERKKGIAKFTRQSSFIEYVNRHKTAESVLFMDDRLKQEPKLLAVLNAHKSEVTTQSEAGESGADHQDFGALYTYPLSDEWLAWTAKKKEMTQSEFAEFIEERIADIWEPNDYVKEYAERLGVPLAKTPARILELSRNLSVTAEMTVKQNINRTTGETVLVFSEQHRPEGGEQFKAPGAFALNIPVFKGGARTMIPVRLRYKIEKSQDGTSAKAKWSVSPQDIDAVLERELLASEMLVAEQTKLPVFRGSPT